MKTPRYVASNRCDESIGQLLRIRRPDVLSHSPLRRAWRRCRWPRPPVSGTGTADHCNPQGYWRESACEFSGILLCIAAAHVTRVHTPLVPPYTRYSSAPTNLITRILGPLPHEAGRCVAILLKHNASALWRSPPPTRYRTLRMAPSLIYPERYGQLNRKPARTGRRFLEWAARACATRHVCESPRGRPRKLSW